jgi:hypothetical protein
MDVEFRSEHVVKDYTEEIGGSIQIKLLAIFEIFEKIILA